MGYGLGVDLGTSFTAAAVCRNGRAEIVELGERSAVIPTVVWAASEGPMLVGESALRRGARDPTRLAREFKRRFGDPVPILLGGAPYAAETLAARVLRRVCDMVAEREGHPPDRIVVTHPASWGDHKLDALRQAVTTAELGPSALLGEPHAAALSYTANERVAVGRTVLVYDLGGGTFDAAILRKTGTGFTLAGRPEGLERLGGVDFDEAVFGHVRTVLSGLIESHLLDDAATTSVVARLRADCVAAKEGLSTDIETAIPVLLPDVQTEVRLTRSEFEAMIQPALGETLAATRRALRAASLKASEADLVLLVGGSSRIPAVARRVSAELAMPVAVDAHPKHAVALGAALLAFEGSRTYSLPLVAAPSPHPARPPGETPGPRSFDAPPAAGRRVVLRVAGSSAPIPTGPPPTPPSESAPAPAPARGPGLSSRSMAMAAVVLGVLVPVLGIALGSAAVRRDARTREGGRTLAWIGIVIGTALTMCLVGVGVALVVHTPSVATQTLEARVVARTGSAPEQVRCPDRLPAQPGASVTCTVTDNRGSLPVRVAVTAVNPDGTVSFEITG